MPRGQSRRFLWTGTAGFAWPQWQQYLGMRVVGRLRWCEQFGHFPNKCGGSYHLSCMATSPRIYFSWYRSRPRNCRRFLVTKWSSGSRGNQTGLNADEVEGKVLLRLPLDHLIFLSLGFDQIAHLEVVCLSMCRLWVWKLVHLEASKACCLQLFYLYFTLFYIICWRVCRSCWCEHIWTEALSFSSHAFRTGGALWGP